jgi:hypothetical protein
MYRNLYRISSRVDDTFLEKSVSPMYVYTEIKLVLVMNEEKYMAQ